MTAYAVMHTIGCPHPGVEECTQASCGTDGGAGVCTALRIDPSEVEPSPDGGLWQRRVWVADYPRKIVVDQQGRAVMAGFSNGPGGTLTAAVVLVRILANGAADPSFGQEGIVKGQVSTTGDRTSALALDHDGRLLVAGYTDGKLLPAEARYAYFYCDRQGSLNCVDLEAETGAP